MLNTIKFVVLSSIFIQFSAIAGEQQNEIVALSRLAGMAEYCQHYYEDSSNNTKAKVMHQFNRQLSEKAVSLFGSMEDSNLASDNRISAYKNYKQKFSSTSDTVCANLEYTIGTLEL